MNMRLNNHNIQVHVFFYPCLLKMVTECFRIFTTKIPHLKIWASVTRKLKEQYWKFIFCWNRNLISWNMIYINESILIYIYIEKIANSF